MTYRHLRNVRGFFSDYYLGSVFGRGDGRGQRRRLSDRETDAAYRRFIRLYERVEGRDLDGTRCREVFIRPLLRDILGLHLGGGVDGIYPLFASAADEGAGTKPLAVALVGASGADLDSGRGSDRPLNRIQAAIATSGLRHGILATAERIRLVRSVGEGPAGAHLEVDLAGLADDDDPESFAIFLRLFGIDAFRPDEAGKTFLDRTEEQSRGHAEKVSEDLKRAVFVSAETLVQGLLDDLAVRGAIADAGSVDDATLRACRDAALLALYRLLFVYYAEARDHRLEVNGIYRSAYSVEGLRDEILASPDCDWPANRSGLWQRLRALFRIYDEGLPAITPWDHIPPRGGDLFSRETPEGRLLDAARLPDSVVAQIVTDLSTTAARRGVGRERVSFRELDVESLGAVYEGLLEFEPKVAREPTFEVRVAGRVFVLSAADLVRLCEARRLAVHGPTEILVDTAAAVLVPIVVEAGDGDAEDAEEGIDADAEGAADDEADEEEGVSSGSVARLVRRLEPGRFHFVPGASRKGSGSFYTPRALVEDLVRHALGPAVDGKSSEEILRLRVLDPACNIAHFLFEAMRFACSALPRAYATECPGHGPAEFRSTTGHGWDDDWRASDAQARSANSEARAWCKRRIAERCLFGVDLNPTAVMLARVALWIESVAGDRPLTYFRHHVRNGNSLLGTWAERLHRPPLPDMPAARDPAQLGLFDRPVHVAIEEALALRSLIDGAAPDALRREGIEPETTGEQGYKEGLRAHAEQILLGARMLFDLRSASAFVPAIWLEWESLCALVADPRALAAHVATRSWGNEAQSVIARERFFHWELEFPEVFPETGRRGFDAVLGNPPWDKVLPTKLEFYARRDVLIRAFKGNDLDRRIAELQSADPTLAAEFAAYRSRTTTIAHVLKRGGDFPLGEARSHAAHEDVSKYFVDRAARLVAVGGAVGFVVPSGIYNGDGCVGIRRFLLTEARIERFYGFENHRKRFFPIHASYKFVNLVFRKGVVADGFDAAFMRRDERELTASGPTPWIVRVERKEIERISPDTFALLEYRGPEDQAIALRMHAGAHTVGSTGVGAWNATFVTWRNHTMIFNSSEDRDLWTDRSTGRAYEPQTVLGAELPVEANRVRAMQAAGFLPVVEGKGIAQHLVGIAGIRWWLSRTTAQSKYGQAPAGEACCAFRDIARNTDERTMIAAVLPVGVAGAHTLSAVSSPELAPEVIATIFNSLSFDFILRLRVAGTHVSFTYLRPLPVPPTATCRRIPAVATTIAWGGGVRSVVDLEDRWPDVWASERSVAEAYGLGADDLAHMLASFMGLRREHAAFHAYLLERIAEWKAEGQRPTSFDKIGAPTTYVSRVADGSSAAGEPRGAERGTNDGR